MKPRSRRNLTLAFTVGLALAVAGCGSNDGLLGVNGGRVQFVLSGDGAAPSTAAGADGSLMPSGEQGHYRNPWFASANVTFSSILARNVDGVLLNVTMELPTTVDVVAMEDGRQIMLPDGELPAGTYDQVVVVMTEVEGVTRDGTTVTFAPAGGGWTAIVERCSFVVDGDTPTTVGLKLVLNESLKWNDNRFQFKPRFICATAEEEEVVS